MRYYYCNNSNCLFNLQGGYLGMKTFTSQQTVVPVVTDVRCNLCGRTVEKNSIGYFEDHVSLTKMWGYHSPYDGESHAIDLCVDCYKGWTAKFEIPPQIEAIDYNWGTSM